MNTWFISDTHFDHTNILTYNNRPFKSVQEMNAALVEEWNKCVAPTDTVWHIGDVAMGRDFDNIASVVGQLNGFIHLVPGNHDTNKKLEMYSNLGWTIEPVIFIMKKVGLVLCHYPIASWPGQSIGNGHIHGHCHGSLQLELGRSLDVGVDANNSGYRPQHIDEVLDCLRKKQVTQVDHHAHIRNS